MSGPSPAGPLIREHRLIERMVALVEAQLDTLAHEEPADPVFIDSATDFIRSYADRCHHGKEEDILFRRLAAKDVDAALLEAMEGLIQDHVYGRSLTRDLAEANRRYTTGDREALEDIDRAMRALVEFYPVHIEKEDRHFFKPSLEYFTEAEQARMLEDFRDFDQQLIHERYRTLVEGLEGK